MHLLRVIQRSNYSDKLTCLCLRSLKGPVSGLLSNSVEPKLDSRPIRRAQGRGEQSRTTIRTFGSDVLGIISRRYVY